MLQITVSSTAFNNGEMIPPKYTCDGENVSPPIEWGNLPDKVKTLALICEDPDAAKTWTHWVLFNLPKTTSSLPAHVPAQSTLDNGAKQGANDSGKIGYSGPCPPSGTHRYFFKLYALDFELNLGPGVQVNQLRDAIKGHIVAQGELMGRYSRR